MANHNLSNETRAELTAALEILKQQVYNPVKREMNKLEGQVQEYRKGNTSLASIKEYNAIEGVSLSLLRSIEKLVELTN